MKFGPICPICGSQIYDSEYRDEELFVCLRCNKPIAYICEQQRTVCPINELRKIGDSYYCSLCGDWQPGYTHFMRKELIK